MGSAGNRALAPEGGLSVVECIRKRTFDGVAGFGSVSGLTNAPLEDNE
jgi:hypothetical protein